jgi:hypothetical protein
LASGSVNFRFSHTTRSAISQPRSVQFCHPDRREQRVTHFVILIEGSNASAGKDLGPFRASEAGTGFESLGPTPSS